MSDEGKLFTIFMLAEAFTQRTQDARYTGDRTEADNLSTVTVFKPL